MRKPNFFIVGAPRCCTGSLWTYLKGHPEIFMPAEKELYFFDSDLWGRSEWSPTLEEYLSHFSEANGQKKIGEATPSYLRSPRAAREIKTFSPGAQIIIMLRNPLDVMHSLHSAALGGTEPIIDFAAALAADERQNGRDRIGYREFTDFPEQVQRYCDLFGRENVHTIIYDDLMANSAAACQGVLRFLGVCPEYAADFPRIHSNKQIRNARFQTLLMRPPSPLRLMGRSLLPPRWRSGIRRALLRSNRVVRPRPPMDETLQRRLKAEIKPKIERLSGMLGRDLSAWCNVWPSQSENRGGTQTSAGARREMRGVKD